MLAAAGADAIRGAVRRFLEQTAAEPALDRYWEGIEPAERFRHAQTLVLTALGVPDPSWSDLIRAHRTLGIDDAAFDLVIPALDTALREAGVSPEVVALAVRRAEQLRPSVVGDA